MIDTLIAKLGVLAASPFLFFGGNANLHSDMTAKAQAQETGNYELVCTELEHNLYFGLRDRNTDGEVSELQAFLKAQDYLSKRSPDGFYGPATYRAVREFQGDHDLRRTGAVGEATRDKIQEISCDEDPQADLEITGIDAPSELETGEEGTWTVNVESVAEGNLSYSVVWGDEGMLSRMMGGERTQSSATFSHTYDEEGTYTPRFTVTDEDGNTVSESAVSVTVSDEDEEDAPSITSLSKTSGYAGDTLTITGTGFASGTEAYIGSTKVDATIESDTSITFEVPALGKGSYDVYVENENGTSNAIRFELKEKLNRLSINGIDAPTRLVVGQEGEWTVNVATDADNLSYSVVWGDEGTGMLRSMNAEIQTSSSFTHVYDEPGTYKPTFTVSDGEGRSAKVSATVIVTN